MKTCKTLIAIFLIFSAFACHNNQNKKDNMNATDVDKTTSDHSNTDNGDQIIQDELKQPESIVKEILITSPRYKELTKSLNELVMDNGGISFELILERSPNQDQENSYIYSKTYDFAIYENYTDRQLITARFSFNPDNKQLYEYDAVNDQLKPIEFDKNLLIKYKALSE